MRDASNYELDIEVLICNMAANLPCHQYTNTKAWNLLSTKTALCRFFNAIIVFAPYSHVET